jgi:DNA mismatch endonuclease (patch repair protein)
MAKRYDVFSKAKRSEVMSKIRGKGNKATEIALAKLFRANGITGWRRHYPIIGRPDFAFPKQKLAVFVDGCFWHGCPKHGAQPKSNKEFWESKLASNKARDRRVNRMLRNKGWHVLRIWEHELSLRNQNKIIEDMISFDVCGYDCAIERATAGNGSKF